MDKPFKHINNAKLGPQLLILYHLGLVIVKGVLTKTTPPLTFLGFSFKSLVNPYLKFSHVTVSFTAGFIPARLTSNFQVLDFSS